MTKTGSKPLLVFLILVLQTAGYSQSFSWKAKLEVPSQTDFYRVPLSLDWLWRLKTDLSDVRIKDEKGVFVPFLIQQYKQDQNVSFLDFSILRNTTDTAVTTLELDAGKVSGTNRIDLVMGNTAAVRRASLSGSNDRKQWFIVDENLQLINATENASDRFVQSLLFPFIRYRYLKLEIRNRGTDPLPIIQAGVLVGSVVKPVTETLKHSGTTYHQTDSADGNSYVWIRNQKPYPVDVLSIEFFGSKFYQREVELYKPAREKRNELLLVTECRSDKGFNISLPSIKAEDLLVVIKNGDNPPLKVLSANTGSQQRQLIAYFEKEKQYFVVGGNKEAQSPQYDLTHFRDSIPSSIPVLSHGEIIPNDDQQAPVTKIKQWWIWPAIVLVLLVLAVVTIRMMGELKQSEA